MANGGGGSRSYVERAVKGLTEVRLSTPVTAVERDGGGITVRDADGGATCFERVVVATHANTALSMLANPTDAEREVLGCFRYSQRG